MLVCRYRHIQPGITPRMEETSGLHRGILFTPCQEAEQRGRQGARLVGSVGGSVACPGHEPFPTAGMGAMGLSSVPAKR